MKTQLRIMAILMGALVSGAAISGNTQPARSTMTVNPGASAGTQGTGG
ncbi:type 1 fimbrial protein, partial [Klebsiella pneumoniae]